MLEVKSFSRLDKRFCELVERGLRLEGRDEFLAAEAVRRVRDQGESGLMQCIMEAENANAFLKTLRVPESEIIAAHEAVSEQFLTALCLARVNARKFHEYQRRRSYMCHDDEHMFLSRQVRALRRIGILCGESFSALLMHAAPAMVAGVGEIAVAAQPDPDGRIDPRILAAAKALGIGEVYRMSGAHAVAAFTFGAGPVTRVDKIVGPGGHLASAAKRLVNGLVGVDLGHGEPELVVIADESANAKFIAGDFLALAERGSEGMLVLLTTDRLVAEAVKIELDRLVEHLFCSRGIRENLLELCSIWVCPDLDAAVGAVNELAPARLALQTRCNDDCVSDVETAGAIFVGPWSTETTGGFFSGINPYLPDAGQARFSSGLGVEDFIREMTVVEYGSERLVRTGRHQTILAEEENLAAQAQSVRDRLELLKMASG